MAHFGRRAKFSDPCVGLPRSLEKILVEYGLSVRSMIVSTRLYLDLSTVRLNGLEPIPIGVETGCCHGKFSRRLKFSG